MVVIRHMPSCRASAVYSGVENNKVSKKNGKKEIVELLILLALM